MDLPATVQSLDKLSQCLDVQDSWDAISYRSLVCPKLLVSYKLHLLKPCLGKMGTQVVVPYREEDEARIFKPMGDLGQIVRMVSSSMALSKSVPYLKLLGKGMGFTERKFNSGMPASFRYCLQSHWKRLRDQVRSLLSPPFLS